MYMYIAQATRQSWRHRSYVDRYRSEAVFSETHDSGNFSQCATGVGG
jgi:hypothetical protein